MAVTPKMLGHVSPNYVFNHSSKPGKYYPGVSYYFCVHNGYAYEFFTQNKAVAVYKITTDENNYIVDFELANVIALSNNIKTYRWLLFGDYAIAINLTSTSTSSTTSSSVSASASASLALSLFKLDGANVTETYIAYGSLGSASSGANYNASSTGTDKSSNWARVKCMFDSDGNFRIPVYLYAYASVTYTSSGASSSVTTNGTGSTKSAIVHFNIYDVISDIEGGGDGTAAIIKEAGTGALYMTGFNDYIMYSKQTLDGTTTNKNGLWKYTIGDDNICTIDTSAVATEPKPTEIPSVYVLKGYQFGIFDHSDGSFLYTSYQPAEVYAKWFMLWLNRDKLTENYNDKIASIQTPIAISNELPSAISIGGYYYNTSAESIGAINLVSGDSDNIITYTNNNFDRILYATKVDISNDNIQYHVNFKRLPYIRLANAHIINYGGRWYLIGRNETISASDSGSVIKTSASNDIYGRTLFTVIEYDESTDEFYNVTLGQKPAISTNNSIIEITRIDFTIDDAELSSSQPTIFFFDVDEKGRTYLISTRSLINSRNPYNDDAPYLYFTGTLDYSSHPLILNPGHKLHICCAYPDAPAANKQYPKFTLYGCELTNN